MNSFVRVWRNLKHRHKFVHVGKGCSFTGHTLEVEGHVELGHHVRIREGCVLRTRGKGKIIFGDRGGCSWYCVLEANNLIQIGNYVGIAEFTVLRDTNHAIFGTDEHWRQTPHITEPIIIEDSCLIGSRCYIGPGVHIGMGAVVAPGSIVTRSIGAYEVWAGAPARCVGHRTKNVSPSRQRLFQELLDKYGLKEADRYGFAEDHEAKKEVLGD